MTDGHVYGRGDYGADNCSDLIEHVEERNCIHGCIHAGDEADRAEYGPGGNCDLLLDLVLEVPIPHFERTPDGIICHARTAPSHA